MFLSILTFDLDLFLGSFFLIGALMGLFWDLDRTQKLFQNLLLFYTVPSILTFDSYLCFGPFLTFSGPNGLFWSLGKVEKQC